MSYGRARVLIRSVRAYNLFFEFSLIRSLHQQYRFVAIDTEFPGVVYHPQKPHFLLSPEERYALLKSNIDDLHFIQVGLTLSDANGNLPDLGTLGTFRFAWEFNLRDFDLRRHRYAPESINFLRSNGFDFDYIRTHGIDSACIAQQLLSSGLVLSGSNIEWVTFSGAYDFGYLIKILTRSPLPERMEDFMNLVTYFFGERLFDVKTITRYCNGLHGGLGQVASTLNVFSPVGRPHRASSNSILTSQTFLAMRKRFFATDDVARYARLLHGLHVS